MMILEGHADWVMGAHVYSDGRILSWSRDGTLRLWSAEGMRLAVLDHTAEVWGAHVYRDGRILSWGYDETLRLWSAEGTQLALLNLALLKGRVDVVHVYDDERILVRSDNELCLWSAEWTRLAVFKGHTDSVMGVHVYSDGRILSWSRDGTLRLWSAEGALRRLH